MSLILLQKNIADPTLKDIFKYKSPKHTCNTEQFREKEKFRFLEVDIEDMKKDMFNLDKNKSLQTFPLKLSKETWTCWLTFYVQTLTALSDHFHTHLLSRWLI